jgi:FKBP-type peptidyl-prolyl cis-trans isomerase
MFSACATESAEQEKAEVAIEEKVAPVNEDDLVIRLSSDLITEPYTQAEKDQNAILNYAMDHSLDVQAGENGLYYQIIKKGEGDFIKWGDQIVTHYKGYFLDGKVFDSSYRKDKPMTFYVGNVIQGWNEGLQKIKPDGKMLLLVPSTLGYGDQPIKDKKDRIIIPENSVLVFEIEVLEKL